MNLAYAHRTEMKHNITHSVFFCRSHRSCIHTSETVLSLECRTFKCVVSVSLQYGNDKELRETNENTPVVSRSVKSICALVVLYQRQHSLARVLVRVCVCVRVFVMFFFIRVENNLYTYAVRFYVQCTHIIRNEKTFHLGQVFCVCICGTHEN